MGAGKARAIYLTGESGEEREPDLGQEDGSVLVERVMNQEGVPDHRVAAVNTNQPPQVAELPQRKVARTRCLVAFLAVNSHPDVCLLYKG